MCVGSVLINAPGNVLILSKEGVVHGRFNHKTYWGHQNIF